MIKVFIGLFFMSIGVSVTAQPGFALVWDKSEVVSESDIIESTMQLWGFVDLLGVVAITQHDLDIIMTRCGAYIVELYVNIRLFSAKNGISNTVRECIDIFKNCCWTLASIEEQHYQRCGLFCGILRDMHARVPNIPIHN